MNFLLNIFKLLFFTLEVLFKWWFQYIYKYYKYYIIPVFLFWRLELKNNEVYYTVKWKKIFFINNWPWWYAIKESFIDKFYLSNWYKWIFFDVWWYVGDVSLYWILYNNPKEIYIFEPQTHLFEIIKRNIFNFKEIIEKKNISIHLINKAVWIKNWELELYLSLDAINWDAWVSYENNVKWKKLVVDIENISKYENIDIDFLKMDIEWWEWEIIWYWISNFSKFNIRNWKIDLHFYKSNINNVDLSWNKGISFIEILNKNNYSVRFPYTKEYLLRSIKNEEEKLSLLLEFYKNEL